MIENLTHIQGYSLRWDLNQVFREVQLQMLPLCLVTQGAYSDAHNIGQIKNINIHRFEQNLHIVKMVIMEKFLEGSRF